MMRVILCLMFLFAGWGYTSTVEDRNISQDSSVTIPLQQYIPADERMTHEARLLLYQALQQGSPSDEILQLMEPQDSNDPFISNYEKLQLYLLLRKYELAADLWINKYIKDEPRIKHFPSTKNHLGEYLDKTINLKTYEILNEQIRLIQESDIPKDSKKLVEILASTPFITNYYGYHPPNKNSIRNITLAQKHSIELYEITLASFDVFECDFPNSKYAPLVPQLKQIIQADYDREHPKLDPAVYKVYTGGIGIEAFYVFTEKLSFSFPIQISRFIVTPTIFDGHFYVSIGFDAFDSKRFKIQPFASVMDFSKDKIEKIAGAQIDWRILLEEKADPKFSLQGYLSLKLKYQAEWHDKKDFQNIFMIGIGVHLW